MLSLCRHWKNRTIQNLCSQCSLHLCKALRPGEHTGCYYSSKAMHQSKRHSHRKWSIGTRNVVFAPRALGVYSLRSLALWHQEPPWLTNLLEQTVLHPSGALGSVYISFHTRNGRNDSKYAKVCEIHVEMAACPLGKYVIQTKPNVA